MNYIKNKLSFKKKWCLVTGATGHLGKTICYHFAELDANIIILDLDEKKCLELKKYLIKKFNFNHINILNTFLYLVNCIID